MSRFRLGLRGRLTLLLGLAVFVTLLMAGYLTGRAVLEPFAKDVVRSHVEQTLYLAQEVEKGADPNRLGERTGLEIRVVDRTPRFVRRARRGHGRCLLDRVRGRTVVACRGPRGGVALALADQRWLVTRRELDVEAPQRRVLLVSLFVGAFVIVLAFILASVATRPVRASVEAMERMAKGDLRHRLPETGAVEVSGVARAFNRMADRVSALLSAERSLMAGISHELRTPLARLRLELELLRDYAVPEKRLDAMEADLQDIDRMIGEILESSRLAIGDRALNLSSVDLRAVVEEALGQVDMSRHEVRLEGDSTLVQADHARLVRVARNLLENASKYAPADTEVTVRLEGTSMEISDQGPGVPAGDLPRLFEPFYRGERGKKTGATGYGLGLMIVRQIVELHGGELSADNEAQGGLRVKVTLPRGEP